MATAASPSAPSVRSSLGYLPSLDGLRGAAVIAVLIYHAAPSALIGGFLGVDVFFVLSGYLITAILIREHERTGRIDLGQFWIRRLLRLVPALLLMVTIATAYKITVGGWREPLIDAAFVLGYIANWSHAFGIRPLYLLGHTCSLAVEMQFYLLWPPLFLSLVASGVQRRTAAGLIVAVAVAVAAYRAWAIHEWATPDRLYNGLDARADSLFLGCATAFALADEGLSRALRCRWISVAAYFAAACLGGLLFAKNYQNLRYYEGLFFVVACGSAAIVAALISGRMTAARRLLEWPPLVWVGVVSYGVYLWHIPVYRIMQAEADASPAALLAVGVPLTFAIAAASYYVIERPALRLKDRFR